MTVKKKAVAPAPAGSFRQTFSELLKARHPVLLIESYEEDRVVEEITAIAGDPGSISNWRSSPRHARGEERQLPGSPATNRIGVPDRAIAAVRNARTL